MPDMKRWKITIELELDSPDIQIGGAPVTEDFIRSRTQNQLRQMLKPEPHSWWVYKGSKITDVREKKWGENRYAE